MKLKQLVDRDIAQMNEPSPQAEKIIADSLGPSLEDELGGDSGGGDNSGGGGVDRISWISGDPIPDDAAKQDAAAKGKGYVDADGRTFDPAIHATDEAGNPRLTKAGKLRKRPGRGSGGGKSAGPQQHKVSRELGRTTAETIFYVSQAAFGEEWAPVYKPSQGIDERAQMIEAWAAYYEATGTTEVPPWVSVAIAMGCYALPRLNQPKTKTRIGVFVERIKAVIKHRRDMKKASKNKDAK